MLLGLPHFGEKSPSRALWAYLQLKQTFPGRIPHELKSEIEKEIWAIDCRTSGGAWQNPVELFKHLRQSALRKGFLIADARPYLQLRWPEHILAWSNAAAVLLQLEARLSCSSTGYPYAHAYMCTNTHAHACIFASWATLLFFLTPKDLPRLFLESSHAQLQETVLEAVTNLSADSEFLLDQLAVLLEKPNGSKMKDQAGSDPYHPQLNLCWLRDLDLCFQSRR